MKKVNLEDVLEALELQAEETNYYYHKKTGNIYMIMESTFTSARREKDIDSYPDWKQEKLKIAEDILNTFDYIKLPEDYEIDDYAIMKNFCNSLENEEIKDKLLAAIKGKGAFRRFKDNIYEFGIEDKWYEYREKAYREIAINWCERNNIKYKRR